MLVMINIRKKLLIIFILIITVCMLSGCSQVVTGPKPQAGNSLQFSVNYSSIYTGSNYRYLFIYSLKPIITPPSNYYLFVPGEQSVYENTQITEITTPNPTANEVINFYFDRYFSSWSDVFLLDSSQIQSTYVYPNINYFPNTANRTINDIYYTQNTIAPDNTIWKMAASSAYPQGFYFEIALNRLKNAPQIGDTIYFMFITLDANHLVKDAISSQRAIIKNQIDQETGERDETESNLQPNLDILDWKLKII